jgi:hypothetical protein
VRSGFASARNAESSSALPRFAPPQIYSAGGGRVARFFVGLTQGYANPALTPEDVRDNFDQVRDETGYSVPSAVADELSALVERLR